MIHFFRRHPERSCAVILLFLFTHHKKISFSFFNILRNSISSRKVIVTIKTKLNLFIAYVQGLFLYKSKLWATTTTTEGRIDFFQRKLLYHVMGVKWPKIIKNKELSEKASVKKWSNLVKKRTFTPCKPSKMKLYSRNC